MLKPYFRPLHVKSNIILTLTVMFTWVLLLLMVYGGSKIPAGGTFGAPLAAAGPLWQSILHWKSVLGPALPAAGIEKVRAPESAFIKTGLVSKKVALDRIQIDDRWTLPLS